MAVSSLPRRMGLLWTATLPGEDRREEVVRGGKVKGRIQEVRGKVREGFGKIGGILRVLWERLRWWRWRLLLWIARMPLLLVFLLFLVL